MILAQNYSCRFGELDLVAELDGFLLFVEVKARTQSAARYPARAAVTPSKRQKLILAAQHYCQCHNTALQPRFDVAEIYFSPEGKAYLNYIKGAFTAEQEYAEGKDGNCL